MKSTTSLALKVALLLTMIAFSMFGSGFQSPKVHALEKCPSGIVCEGSSQSGCICPIGNAECSGCFIPSGQTGCGRCA